MFKEFKEFISRGNVVDMAVGVIIGVAFGKVISSLVADVLMPPIGLLLGKVDFSNLSITLHQKTADSALVAIRYGAFINTLIDFLIITFVMFIVIKQFNRLTQFGKKTAEPIDKECPYCCSNIPVKASRCSACTSQLV